ncbi:MAG TPA: hypothetical protein VIY08_06020 [Candidatus Nitrosocosmicus sp.]
MPKAPKNKKRIDYEIKDDEFEESSEESEVQKDPNNLELSGFLSIKDSFELSGEIDELAFIKLKEEEGQDWLTKFLNDRSKLLETKKAMYLKLRSDAVGNPSAKKRKWLRDVYKKSYMNLKFQIEDNDSKF